MTAPERTNPPWQSDDPWFVYLGQQQELLRADAAAANGYGADHPDVWGGIWWDDDARLKIGLTVLNSHGAAVAALLTHPADVDIVAVPRTAAEIEAVRADVRAVMAEHQAARQPGEQSLFASVGIRDHRVGVDLHPAGEALAHQLHARHGDALDLRVGALPYPPDLVAPPAAGPGAGGHHHLAGVDAVDPAGHRDRPRRGRHLWHRDDHQHQSTLGAGRGRATADR